MREQLKREVMSNVDAAWYRMETPTNLMMVSGFMYFEEKIPREIVQEVLEQRYLIYGRFRQRVVDNHANLRTPTWEEVPVTDWDYHIIEEKLAVGYEGLKRRSGQLQSQSLDFTKPLWQMHIIDCGEGAALLLRIHHCIADGIALMGVLFSMTGNTAEESLAPPALKEVEPPRMHAPGNLFDFAGNAINKVGKLTGKLMETLSHPAKIVDMAKLGTQGALAAAKLIFKLPDPTTLFKGELGVPKLATWSQPIPLDDIKRIKNVTGTTVNDVLLTAMAGGLGRYLRGHDQKTRDLVIRAGVPINLRKPQKIQQLGNEFGLVFLDLPVGIEDALDRLFAVKKNMDAIKNSPEAVVALGILKATGMTPAEVQKLVVSIFSTKFTAVMTNVPGPREPIYLGGRKMDHMMFWVPRAGDVGMGISIFSYAGEVRLGLATDTGIVPDPETIIEGFHEEMEAMMQLVRQVEE